MAHDLDAAVRAARYLASTVASIRALAAAAESQAIIKRLATELNQRYPDCRDAIRDAAMELRLIRESAVHLGDIVAPTAHEAAAKWCSP